MKPDKSSPPPRLPDGPGDIKSASPTQTSGQNLSGPKSPTGRLQKTKWKTYERRQEERIRVNLEGFHYPRLSELSDR